MDDYLFYLKDQLEETQDELTYAMKENDDKKNEAALEAKNVERNSRSNSELDSLKKLIVYFQSYINYAIRCKDSVRAKISIVTSYLSHEVTLTNFSYIRKLTNGSFADVHLIKDSKNSSHYALKSIKQQYENVSTTDGHDNNSKEKPKKVFNRKQIRQIMHEKKLLICTSKCFPEAFVQFYSSFTSHNHWFFVMEYCAGGDCLSLIRNMKSVPENAVVVLIAEICIAVKWLHENGIIHRDIKPDNIFITAKGHVKVGDFGISTRRFKKTKKDKTVYGNGSSRSLRRSIRSLRANSSEDFQSHDHSHNSNSGKYDGNYNHHNHTSHLSGAGADREKTDVLAQFSMGYFHKRSREAAINSARSTDSQSRSQASTSGFSVNEFDSEVWHSDDSEDTYYRDLSRSSLGGVNELKGSFIGGYGGYDSETPTPRPSSSQKDNKDNNKDNNKDSNKDSNKDANSDAGSGSSSYYYKRDNSSDLHFTPIGNISYMSPECIRGSGYDQMVDWWAIGVMTFHLLTGRTPFQFEDGQKQSFDEERDQIVKANIIWGKVGTAHNTAQSMNKERSNSTSTISNLSHGNESKTALSDDKDQNIFIVSQKCKSFLNLMLQEEKKNRLGYGGAGGKERLLTEEERLEIERNLSRNSKPDFSNESSREFLMNDASNTDASPRSVGKGHLLRNMKREKSQKGKRELRILDHSFFDEINFLGLFKGQGPIQLNLLGNGDSQYFDRAPLSAGPGSSEQKQQPIVQKKITSAPTQNLDAPNSPSLDLDAGSVQKSIIPYAAAAQANSLPEFWPKQL